MGSGRRRDAPGTPGWLEAFGGTPAAFRRVCGAASLRRVGGCDRAQTGNSYSVTRRCLISIVLLAAAGCSGLDGASVDREQYIAQNVAVLDSLPRFPDSQ